VTIKKQQDDAASQHRSLRQCWRPDPAFERGAIGSVGDEFR
jgi:hypothetical protein